MQKYGELLRTLFEKRGILDEHAAEIFLNPSYERDLHNPFLMKDMEKAVDRLYQVVKSKEKIIVYADYDCDGIPGAVILTDLFKLIGYKNFDIYITKRNSEGYGLNISAIQKFAEGDAKLLVTIDLGITAVEEVKEAKKLGVDVIITDHHLPRLDQAGRAALPQAYAILNPKVDDYPEKMLCGAGVVFKLIQGFLEKYGELYKINEGAEKWMLDMAGLATLSDMVPLTGENRAIAYFGMKVLRKSPRPGLQKLLAKMNVEQRFLSEDDVLFMVTPKINVASRMDDPMRAYELLSTTDEVKAGMLTHHLSKINDERKNIVVNIMREVNKKLENEAEERKVIVIGNPMWRVGVLGLVAGKILDAHKKPVFVWGKDENDLIKGSCRSDGSVSLVELMGNSKESFLEFGGHELAGGFTVHHDHIHFLEEKLSLSYEKLKKVKEDEILHEIKTDLGAVNLKNWKEIEQLSPFGCGNPKPTFFFENTKIEKLKKFGKNGSGEHLEIIFSDDSGKSKAVAFFSNKDSFQRPLEEGLPVSLLASFDLSRFRGKEELRLRIVDIL